MLKGIEFFSKSGNKYFYDDFTGFIFNINQQGDIRKIEEKHLHLRSLCLNSSSSKDFDANDIKSYLYDRAEGFKQLFLEVTSMCNFRCKYCTYSEYYDKTRSHGSEMMSFYVAKKAINYYFENFKIILNRNPQRKPIINFYGGEPLLNFKLIKECVNYINKHYKAYLHENMYHITTNGLLLNEKIQDFLYENKFSVLVSIDGYKENHDRNRLTASGGKTFDLVFNNYKKMRTRYHDAKLSAAGCMDYKTDIERIMNFSNKENIDFVTLSMVEANNSTYYSKFSEIDKFNYSKKYNKILNMMFDFAKGDLKDENKFLFKYMSRHFKDIIFRRKPGNGRTEICPYSASCIMGEKIYVDTFGKFYLCEKMGCKFDFGNVEQGLDFNKIVTVFKKYRDQSCAKCKDCNITKLCTLCLKDLDQNFSFTSNKNLCEIQRQGQKRILENYVTLMESNPTLFDESTAQYYQKINTCEELN